MLDFVDAVTPGRCPEKTPQRTKAKMCMYFGVQIVAAVLGAFTYSTVYGGGSFRLGPGFVGEAGHHITCALVCVCVLCGVPEIISVEGASELNC